MTLQKPLTGLASAYHLTGRMRQTTFRPIFFSQIILYLYRCPAKTQGASQAFLTPDENLKVSGVYHKTGDFSRLLQSSCF